MVREDSVASRRLPMLAGECTSRYRQSLAASCNVPAATLPTLAALA